MHPTFRIVLVLLLLVPCAVCQACFPQQWFNPGGNLSSIHIGGNGYTESLLSWQTISLSSPSLVTALNVYPYSSFIGSFSVSAGLFTALVLERNSSLPTVYVTGQLLAQSAVHVLVNTSYPDYRYTGSTISPVPIVLPLLTPLPLAAGNYSLAWWFSFTGEMLGSPLFSFVTYDECSRHIFIIIEGGNSSFTDQAGIFPAAFNHSAFRSGGQGSPGILVSLTATCPVGSSSSSSSGISSAGSSSSSSFNGAGEPSAEGGGSATTIAIVVVVLLAAVAVAVAVIILYRRRKAAASVTARGASAVSADKRRSLLDIDNNSSDRYGE